MKYSKQTRITLSVMSQANIEAFELCQQLRGPNDIVLSWDGLFDIFSECQKFDWLVLLKKQNDEGFMNPHMDSYLNNSENME